MWQHERLLGFWCVSVCIQVDFVHAGVQRLRFGARGLALASWALSVGDRNTSIDTDKRSHISFSQSDDSEYRGASARRMLMNRCSLVVHVVERLYASCSARPGASRTIFATPGLVLGVAMSKASAAESL